MGSSPTKLTGAHYAGVGRGPVYEDDLFFCHVLSGGNALAVAAVADGMGEGRGGLRAAQAAVGVVKSLLLARLYGMRGRRLSELEFSELLKEAIQKANAQVIRHNADCPMGATLTVAIFTDEFMAIGHVGDCRVYRLGDGHVECLTRDHAVGLALTRRLGKEPTMQIDLTIEPIAPGQIFLLCSNGLHGSQSVDEIALTMETTPNLADGCVRLVNRALARGGPDADSASIVAVEMGQYPRRPGLDPLPADEPPVVEPPPQPVAPPAPPRPAFGPSLDHPAQSTPEPAPEPPPRQPSGRILALPRDGQQRAAILGLGLLAMLAVALIVAGLMASLSQPTISVQTIAAATAAPAEPEALATGQWPWLRLVVTLAALAVPLVGLLWWRLGHVSENLRRAFLRFW